jgi:hypothetical protein
MRYALTFIATLMVLVSAANFTFEKTNAMQFPKEFLSYGYVEAHGSTVRVYKSRTSYETITFQCKRVLDARWSGSCVIVKIETQAGRIETWRCDDKFVRRKMS